VTPSRLKPAPPAPLEKASGLRQQALKNGKGNLHKLDSIIGVLAFVSKLVVLGSSFLRRLYKVKSRYPQAASQRWHLTDEVKANILWWQQFLPVWNGIAIIRSLHD
jgi:hypothetical protein